MSRTLPTGAGETRQPLVIMCQEHTSPPSHPGPSHPQVTSLLEGSPKTCSLPWSWRTSGGDGFEISQQRRKFSRTLQVQRHRVGGDLWGVCSTRRVLAGVEYGPGQGASSSPSQWKTQNKDTEQGRERAGAAQEPRGQVQNTSCCPTGSPTSPCLGLSLRGPPNPGC